MTVDLGHLVIGCVDGPFGLHLLLARVFQLGHDSRRFAQDVRRGSASLVGSDQLIEEGRIENTEK